MSSFLERLKASLGQLADILPGMLGAIGILIVGYLLARIVSRALGAILRKTRFNEMFAKGGFHQGIDRAGHPFQPTRIITNLVFWLVMFGVILMAAWVLGLDSLTNVFNELVSYIPSVIGAIVIIIVGIVLGSFVSGLILASAGGIEGGTTLARVGRGGVVILAIFMALQEIGIAGDIVTIAFGILFGAIALALALAFGLGNRDLAGEVTRAWYEKYKAEREAVERETQLSLLADEAETGPASPNPKRTIPAVEKSTSSSGAQPPAAAG